MMNINYNNMTAYQFQYALRNDYPEAMEFFKKHARKIDSGANWAAYNCDKFIILWSARNIIVADK